MPDREVMPTIIVPDRSFLVGSIHGLNAGRRLEKGNDIQPIVTETQGNNANEIKHVPYMGYFLHCTCSKCGYMFAWDDPNDIPEESLECGNDECDNIVILYGVGNSNLWRIGTIKL